MKLSKEQREQVADVYEMMMTIYEERTAAHISDGYLSIVGGYLAYNHTNEASGRREAPVMIIDCKKFKACSDELLAQAVKQKNSIRAKIDALKAEIKKLEGEQDAW